MSPPATDALTDATSPSRRLQVTIRGGMKTYDRLDAVIQEISEQQFEITLQILPNGSASVPNPTPREYQALLTPEVFNAFWNQLQELGIETLPNSAPAGNQPDAIRSGRPQPTAVDRHDTAPVIPSRVAIDAPIYQFVVQDQARHIHHQFQVYAPSSVEDPRYQQITTAFYKLVTSTFGNRLFFP